MRQNESKLTKIVSFWCHPGTPRSQKTNKNQWFFNIFAFPIFGLPDLFWTPLGPLLALSWVPLAPLGSPQAPQGVLLRASRWPMGCPWDPRNLSWMPLGPILGTVSVSSSLNGAGMTCFGAPRDQFCPIWRPAFRHSRAPGGPKGPTCTSNELYNVYYGQFSSFIFSVIRLKRLGRLGQSQGDLISG